MLTPIAIALGGAAGALSRYGISLAMAERSGAALFTATFLVNIVGAFLLGTLAAAFAESSVPAELRALLTVGFLGSFTTFSTWQLEAFAMLRSGDGLAAVGALALSVITGFAACAGGYYLVSTLVRALAR
jgi:CrcB protein